MPDFPPQLPADAIAYGRSPDFTNENLPDKLRNAHNTKGGTWGLLHVLEGELLFCLEEPQRRECHLVAGDTMVIEPQTLHHVDFIQPGRFYIEFYRLP